MFVQHLSPPHPRPPFSVLLTVYFGLCVLLESLSWRRDSSRIRSTQSSSPSPLFFFQIQTTLPPRLFLNPLMHLPSRFHAGVAVKPYPPHFYRHRESIIAGSTQRFGLGNELRTRSVYNAQGTGTEPADHVFNPPPVEFLISAQTLETLCVW